MPVKLSEIACLFGFHKFEKVDDCKVFSVHPHWMKKCKVCGS